MSLRRSLSDITKLEMRLQTAQAENARLKVTVQELSRNGGGVATAGVSAPPSSTVVSIGELLHREERPHPASGPKKKPKPPRKSKKGYLKGVPPGSLLTQPEIIGALLEQEGKEREKVARKAAAKTEAQELRKKARAEAAAGKKRKKAEDGTLARKKREAAKAEEDSSEEDSSEEKEEAKEGEEGTREGCAVQ